MKFDKIINKIKKSNYDVSICECLIESDNIEYMAKNNNSVCVYTWNKEIIEKIKNVADNMNYKTIFKDPKGIMKCYEVFIY